MSIQRKASSVVVVTPREPPELTVGAAQVLLRILRKAHARNIDDDRADTPDTTDERDVA